ncbi:MAG: hypothetical protein QOI80_2845 [Solirubrobacteraceae bacterium]|nr:hypothetical protein [Solirubrobacteraceae bacterium]
MPARRVPALVALAVLAGLAVPEARASQHFVTRPDLEPPKVRIGTPAPAGVTGYVFTAPKGDTAQRGPMIFDNDGKLVWYRTVPEGESVLDFRVQSYLGKPVLTWWRGLPQRGFGFGSVVIFDSSYRRIATVRAKRGYKMDFHDFTLTPQGTALFDCYRRVHQDTRSIPGGSRRDRVLRNVIQEVDVKTGKLLFQWNANRHIHPRESFRPEPLRPHLPLDYIHLNSVDPDRDGNLIVSARETSTIYKINRRTGRIMWRLGGKRSDYALARHAHFKYQHDAHRQRDGTITLFDNHAVSGGTKGQSSGLVLRLHDRTMTATKVRRYTSPRRQLAASEGNMQILPDGHVFIGWGGNQRNVTEFAKGGRRVFEALFVNRFIDTYRAYRFPWTAQPAEPPVAKARRSGGNTLVDVSWNGATEVAFWRVYGGTGATLLNRGWSGAPSAAFWMLGGTPAASASLVQRVTEPPTGFETRLTYAGSDGAVRVEALDADGNVIGHTRDVAVT